jgi:hypothetical protein
MRAIVSRQGGWVNILPKTNRKSRVCLILTPQKRKLAELSFNKLKYYRSIALSPNPKPVPQSPDRARAYRGAHGLGLRVGGGLVPNCAG